MGKYYIGVDLEGVACVVGTPGEGLVQGSANYQFAARQALREANAAAQALFENGADEVIIWDNHGSGVNFDYDLVDPRCKIALGSGFRTRFPGIDESFDGVLFIGYHAREATHDSVLAHTYSSRAFQGYSINGVPMGEMELDAAYAGEHGVKVLFTASDAAAVSQAKESFPWIEAVETKRSWGWSGAISLHPQAAVQQIHDAVARAVRRQDEMKAFRLPGPMELSIRYKRMDAANMAQLYDKDRRPFAFTDAFTRTGVIDSISQLFD